MKPILLIFTMISLPVQADIFVCKDAQNKIVYQDEPCSHQTIRTIKNVPAPTLADQQLAQERIEKINETSQLRAAKAESDRIEQEKRDIELEKIALEKQRIELLAQQALAERHPYPVFIYPGYKNRYGSQGFNKPYDRKFRNRPGSPPNSTPEPPRFP